MLQLRRGDQADGDQAGTAELDFEARIGVKMARPLPYRYCVNAAEARPPSRFVASVIWRIVTLMSLSSSPVCGCGAAPSLCRATPFVVVLLEQTLYCPQHPNVIIDY
jgi:hypothetical protein